MAPDNQDSFSASVAVPDSDIRHHPDLPRPRRGFSSWVGRPVWKELRSPLELRSLHRSALWHGEGMTLGRGRPVVIVPGFLAGPRKAESLRRILDLAGWAVDIAEVGRNAGPAIDSIDACLETIDRLTERTGEPVTIIGHSRGGQFARVIAVTNPERVRQVIAVGSPLRAKYPNYLVVKLPAEFLDKAWRLGAFGYTDPAHEKWVDDHRYLAFPDSVDLVSVFSKSDGVIDWRLMLEEAATPIEVRTSHQGIMNSIDGIMGIGEALERLDQLDR